MAGSTDSRASYNGGRIDLSLSEQRQISLCIITGFKKKEYFIRNCSEITCDKNALSVFICKEENHRFLIYYAVDLKRTS